MQTRSRIFDDLAKVAGGAVSTFTGLKAEIEVLIRQQIERFLLDADMVPRDEFDAVKELAANARSGEEALDKRVLNLERKLGVKVPSNTKGKAKTKKTKPKKQMKKKLKKLEGASETTTTSSSEASSGYTKRQAYLDFLEAKVSNTKTALRNFLRKHADTPDAERYRELARKLLKNF